MSDPYITIRFLVGTSIEAAARHAIWMVHKLDCCVMFDFNGVPVYVNYGDTEKSVIGKYNMQPKELR